MVSAPRLRICLALALAAASAPLGACSLIYNPNNIAAERAEAGSGSGQDATHLDAAVDAEIIFDADPDQLALTGAEPSLLVEGQGVGGSYPTILVIHGTQMVANMTTVAITAHDGTGPVAQITVDNAHLEVAADGKMLAVPVTFAVDTVHGTAAAPLRLDLTVTQMGSAGPVSRALTTTPGPDGPVLALSYLDELTNASPEFMTGAIAPGTYLYSQVTVTGGLRPSTTTGPLRITAISSLSITGVTDAKAVLGTPGAGGNGGGNGGGASTLGPAIAGGNGGGGGGGKSSGGGGGFGSVGQGGAAGGAETGDEGLVAIAQNRSSGGGGGVGGTGIGAVGGGVGGAGGGVLELTAGGDLAVGDLTTIGGNGTATAAAGNGGGGGGGAGGTVLLRARHALSFTSVLATGGLAGGGGSVASFAGGDGRVRIDVPTPTLAIGSTPAAFRGPVLAANTTLIVRTPTPTFTVIGATDKSFTYFFTNADGAQAGPVLLIGPAGSQPVKLPADKPFARGINHFCLLVEGGAAASGPEAQSCTDFVYLYTP